MSLKEFETSGVSVEWKVWKLPEDAAPSEKPENYKQKAKVYLEQLLKKTGLSITPPSKSRNTYLAHVGAKFAAEKGAFEQYHLRMFQAVWENDENIEDIQILFSILNEIGLSPSEFEASMDSMKELVEADYQHAKESKIWTIPTYIGSNGVIQAHHFEQIPGNKEIAAIL